MIHEIPKVHELAPDGEPPAAVIPVGTRKLLMALGLFDEPGESGPSNIAEYARILSKIAL